MNLSEISIKNPVFAWMLMIGLMVFGVLGCHGMGVGQMPDVDFPVLNVSVLWEGAAPEVMESDVVDIIEDSVMGIEGLRDISSSSSEGKANIKLEFDLDRDIDVALQEVQSKISEARRACRPIWTPRSFRNSIPKTSRSCFSRSHPVFP